MQTATKIKCTSFQKLSQLAWGWLYEVNCSDNSWKTSSILNWLYNNVLDCSDVDKVITCYIDDSVRKLSIPDICTSRVITSNCTITITDPSTFVGNCRSVITIKQL